MSQIKNSKQPDKHHNMLIAMTAAGGRDTGWSVSELFISNEANY